MFSYVQTIPGTLHLGFLVAIYASSLFYIAESQWMPARAVVFGNPSGSNTFGACYDGFPTSKPLGSLTAGASAILFSNGSLNDCGACYQVRCVNSTNCKKSSTVTVTVTNVCYDGPNAKNPQCSYPKKQLSLSQPAFSSIANIQSVGAVTVEIRRVNCTRNGTIQVYIYGNPYYIVFSFSNVAQGGALKSVRVKGNGVWTAAKLAWGAQWYIANSPGLRGNSLSFQLQDKLTGKITSVEGAVPSNWSFNTTYYTAVQVGISTPPPKPVSPPPPSPPSSWTRNASASSTSSSNYGSCYGNISQTKVLGNYIAAASSVLYTSASSTECGACYEIRCTGSDYCLNLNKTVRVTIGNKCVSSNNPNDRCGQGRAHFVLTKPAYTNLAPLKSGAIPIEYRRVACTRTGPVQYYITGNKYWIVVTPLNVGGPGSLSGVSIKGTKTSWIPMKNSWGANWRVSGHPELYGQALSFRLFSKLSGLTLEKLDVAPKNWNFNAIYTGGQFASLY